MPYIIESDLDLSQVFFRAIVFFVAMPYFKEMALLDKFGNEIETKRDSIDFARSRFDGWGQILAQTAHGTSLKRAKDLESGSIYQRLSFHACENLFATNTLIQKIVELPVTYGLLNGWRFTIKKNTREQTLKFEEEVEEEIDKPFNLADEVYNAVIWGRLYGSAYLLIDADDGNEDDPSQELDLKSITKINDITALTPFELFPQKTRFTDMSYYLEPDYYVLAPIQGGLDSGLNIHRSRVIRFNGIYLSRLLYISNNFTHDSVIQPCLDVLLDYTLALEACGYSIAEFSQGVYKMKGLAAMLQQGQESKIVNRMRTVDATKNLHRTIIMDAENESYDRVAGRFNGMESIISKLEKQLVAVSRIPHNLLFSEAAGHGKAMFSAGGDSEWGEWETTVHSWRKRYLTSNLEKLYNILFANQENKVTKGEIPDFKIVYSGQRKLSEQDEAKMYDEISKTDRENIEGGILTPDEVRKTRYAQGGTFSDYSIRVELDEEAFKKAQQAQEEAANQPMFAEPEKKPEEEPEEGEEEPTKPDEAKVVSKSEDGKNGTVVKNGVRFTIGK